MKYNQYALVKTDFDQKVKELTEIKFLPSDYVDYSFVDLFKYLFKQAIVEAKTDASKEAKLAEFAVNDKTSLADFLKNNPSQITADEFYCAALQLLGYHVVYDYAFDKPTSLMKKNALPIFGDITNKNDLISAFYLLLNTRAKNGQTYLDVIAGRGYFTQFYGQNKFMFFNGKSLPVFDTSKVIREVVYVESDLDTDQDGESDLLQVTIFRVPESNAGLKVPALYTADPYFGGIIDNVKRNHKPQC